MYIHSTCLQHPNNWQPSFLMYWIKTQIICLPLWLSLLYNTSYILFYKTSRSTLAPTYPPIHQVPRILSSAVKWTRPEDGHSPPFSVKVKECSCTSTSCLYAFTACTQMILLHILVNHHCNTSAVLLQPSQIFALNSSYVLCILII